MAVTITTPDVVLGFPVRSTALKTGVTDVGSDVAVTGWTIAKGLSATFSLPASVKTLTSFTRVGGYDTPQVLSGSERTNICLQSDNFGTTWAKLKTGTGLDPVITADNATAPDGVGLADKVVFDTGANTTTSDRSALTQTRTSKVTAGQPYTYSIWVKGTAGARILTRGVASGNYKNTLLTGAWQRITGTETAANTSMAIEVGLRQGQTGGAIAVPVTVWLWGAQVEAGSVAGAYIPTTTTDGVATDYTNVAGVITPLATSAGYSFKLNGALYPHTFLYGR